MRGASKDQLDSLIQVVRISQDIKTSFRLRKCAVLEMRRGKQVDSCGIDLPYDQHIGEIGEEGYKYIGILQLDQNLNTKMKVKMTSQCIKRVKILNVENLIGGIYWAVGVVRYSAGLVDVP